MGEGVGGLGEKRGCFRGKGQEGDALGELTKVRTGG